MSIPLRTNWLKDGVHSDRAHLGRAHSDRAHSDRAHSVNPRTATGMDRTLPKCNFENLKPVEISKNSFGII